MVVHTCEQLRQALREIRDSGNLVGFVPTMGALHDGHLALVREARRRASCTLVSIFVNPTQFGPHEDFARYPRDLAGDVARLRDVGASLVFAPPPEEMYPPGDVTRVRVGAMADTLCGPFRPNHFEGVATVVAKLFALAGPCVAVFGRKDYQQLKIVERMAADLRFDVDIVGVSTVRDADGLAMSSRNAYLSSEERARARAIPRALARAARAFAAGEQRVGALRALAADELAKARPELDYVAINDAQSLAAIDDDTTLAAAAAAAAPAVLAIALRIGRTRLIDNLVLGQDVPPACGTDETA
jgi:pantoate--beta-alanine ligase